MSLNGAKRSIHASKPKINRPCRPLLPKKPTKCEEVSQKLPARKTSATQIPSPQPQSPHHMWNHCRTTTWNDILSSTSERKSSSLGENHGSQLSSERNFAHDLDPVKTIQFLSMELKNQIKDRLPDDENITKTIRQIQHSIKRLTLLTSTCVGQPVPFNKTQDERNNALLGSFDKLQENYTKSEENCRRLGELHQKLMNENSIVKMELDRYNSEINRLKKENKLLQRQLEETNLKIMKTKNLDEQCKYLQTEIKTLESERDKMQHTNALAYEKVLAKYENSLEKIGSLETECFKSKENLMIAKLENEKLTRLLQCQDNHVQQMQKEFTEIHQLAQDQLQILNINFEGHHFPNTSKPPVTNKSVDMNDHFGVSATNNCCSHRPKMNVPEQNDKSHDDFRPFGCATSDAPAVKWPHGTVCRTLRYDGNNEVSDVTDTTITSELNGIFDIPIPQLIKQISALDSDNFEKLSVQSLAH